MKRIKQEKIEAYKDEKLRRQIQRIEEEQSQLAEKLEREKERDRKRQKRNEFLKT